MQSLYMKIEVAREESPGWTATHSNLNSTTTFSNFQWDLQMTWQKSLAHIAIGAIATFLASAATTAGPANRPGALVIFGAVGAIST